MNFFFLLASLFSAAAVSAAAFFGGFFSLRSNLARFVKTKAFPKNIEVAVRMPLYGDGTFMTLHYSISFLPEKDDYTPRLADDRLGYFLTAIRDYVEGDPQDGRMVRYVNRWRLEKADPKLKKSPPKEPIVFYVEKTVPIAYRQAVHEGILEWNKAFENVGIINAIEVYQQDEATGAHMEKDPEDARYNFVLWTNSGMGFAIGPSRVHPKTGQILDADIVMDEGFISGWIRQWDSLIPQAAMENFGPETLEWLETRPNYDPRIRLADPSKRKEVEYQLAVERAMYRGVNHPAMSTDPTLMGDEEYDGLVHRVSQINGACQHCAVKAMDMAFIRLNPELISSLADKDGKGKKVYRKRFIKLYEAIAAGHDPTAAFKTLFGDLNALGKEAAAYIEGFRKHLKTSKKDGKDDKAPERRNGE
mgnify:CR=1 FL=1